MNTGHNTVNIFKEIVCREIKQMTSKPLYFVILIAIPIFTIVFLSTIFGNGQIENVPVGVVDYTESQLSEQIVEKVDATAMLNIAEHKYLSEKEAFTAMQKMEIYGFLVIPQNFDKQLYSGKKPTLTYYYQKAILATGEKVNGAFLTVLGAISADFIDDAAMKGGSTQLQVKAVAMPIESISTPLYNHDLDFTTYISYPFIFVFLQILLIILVVYLIGSDKNFLKQKISHSTTYNRTTAVIVGKISPYFIIFSIYALIANYICFGILAIPINQSIVTISIASIMLIAASISIGILIALFIPNFSIAISIASMYGALGATMCGVTFPIEQMHPVIQALSTLFPIRHFTTIYHNIVYFNLPLQDSIAQMVILYLFSAAFIAIPSKKIRTLISANGKFSNLPIIYSILLIALGGTMGYSILYNILYLPNTVKDVPIAVIDESNTLLSRTYTEYLNATEGIVVSTNIPDMQQAERLITERKIRGIIYLPHDFSNRIYRGEGSAYTLFGTTTSLLYYLTIQESATGAMLQLNSQVRKEIVKHIQPEGQLTLLQAPQLKITGIPVYNKNGGYADFLIPAVLIVALFQTMLMAVGVYRGGSRTRYNINSIIRTITGFTSLYFLVSLFVIGLIPIIFNLPNIGNPIYIFPFLLLFLLTTSIFTTLLSYFYTNSEIVNLIVPFFSVGLIFISGISFPREAMPSIWQAAYYIFPSSPAITGYIKMNSMGAGISAIKPEIIVLIIQGAVYGAILYFIHFGKMLRAKAMKEL